MNTHQKSLASHLPYKVGKCTEFLGRVGPIVRASKAPCQARGTSHAFVLVDEAGELLWWPAVAYSDRRTAVAESKVAHAHYTMLHSVRARVKFITVSKYMEEI